MASVLPKVKTYFFLSMICLMINFSIFAVSLINNENKDINIIGGESKYTDEDILISDSNYDTDLGDFVLASGSSFIPFFSLLPMAFISNELPVEMTVITGMIIGIISAFQVFLLSIIILNFVPKILGSGVDV